MTDNIVTQLLILFLLFAVNCRIFFLQRSRRDTFVILAPVSLILSFLMILTWGLTFLTTLVLLISILTCITNINSLYRLFSRLMTDYYTTIMCVSSCFNLLLIVFATIFILFFRTVPLPMEEILIKEETQLLYGSYAKGLSERTSIFDSYDVKVSRFFPENTETENLPKIIFVTDPRQSTDYLKSIAIQTASLGYEVIIGDYNTSILNFAKNKIKGIFFPENMEADKISHIRTSVAQYNALIRFLNLSDEQNIILAGDGFCKEALNVVYKIFPNKIDGWFGINGKSSNEQNYSVNDWHDGFGDLGQREPCLKWILERTDLLNKRDITLFDSVLIANQINSFSSSIMQNSTLSFTD